MSRLVATVRSSGRALCAAAVIAVAAAGLAAAASSPSVTTGAASSITTSSAVLNGTVNPNGAATTAHFEWGLTTSYGVTGGNLSAGSGTKPVPVHFTAAQLLPGTVYHYRLDATNRFGEAFGVDRTLTTTGNPPPDAATGPATSVGQSTVTLTGVINPHGEATSWAFQLGLDTTYGYETFGGTIPAGNSAVTVSEQLRGLEPGTTFHYRIVAYHQTVPVAGSDSTFITEPSPRPVPYLSAHTTAGQVRRSPYTFGTVGKVQGPPQFPASVSCNGSVSLSVLLGARVLATSDVPLASDCTYKALVAVRRVPGLDRRHPRARLRVVARFGGNSYLAPASSRSQSYWVGKV